MELQSALADEAGLNVRAKDLQFDRNEQSEDQEDSYPGEPKEYKECSPPAAGPHAESPGTQSKFLDEDTASDEPSATDGMERSAAALLPKLIDSLLPTGSSGVLVQSKATIGPGSLFGRPTPAELLLLSGTSNSDEDSPESDEEELSGWKAGHNTGSGTRGATYGGMQGQRLEVELGSVSFYSRGTMSQTPPLRLVCETPMLSPVVQVSKESRIPFTAWLARARSSPKTEAVGTRILPGATSSSLE